MITLTLTMPWWAFLIWGFVLAELGRLSSWAGDTAGRAFARWIRNRKEQKP